MSTPVATQPAPPTSRDRHGGHVAFGLLIAGVGIAIVGVLALAAPLRAYEGRMGFEGRPTASLTAPFSIAIRLDPASGVITVPADLRTPSWTSLSFLPPVAFTLEVKADPGGPISVSVSDPHRSVAADVTVPARHSKRVSFSVHDEVVTVRISSETGKLRRVWIEGESPDRNVWVWSAEVRNRQPEYLVVALLLVGLGSAVIVSAFLGQPAAAVGRTMVAATVAAIVVALVVAFAGLLGGYGLWFVPAALVGTALALRVRRHGLKRPPELLVVPWIMVIQAAVIVAAGLAAVVAMVNVGAGQTGNYPLQGFWVSVCLALLVPAVILVGLAFSVWRGSRVGMVLSVLAECLVCALVCYLTASIVRVEYRYEGGVDWQIISVPGLVLLSAESIIVGALVGLRNGQRRRSPSPQPPGPGDGRVDR
jgi:hypothetical protein